MAGGCSCAPCDAIAREAPAAGESEPVSRAATLVQLASRLLSSLQDGSMSETAYDTAWIARVPDPNNRTQRAFPSAIDWLLRHQHADGSWGGQLEIVHDRVVSTLAAVLALVESPSARSARAVQAGIAYLARSVPRIDDDFVETVGFELIMPPLLAQARRLGLPLPATAASSIERLRADKLQRLPAAFAYFGLTSLTHSLEFLGDDLQPDLVRRWRASNGSYGASPSATAYVLMHQWDAAGAAYLRAVLDLSSVGGACNVFPFEIFERAWSSRLALERGRCCLAAGNPARERLMERAPIGRHVRGDGAPAEEYRTAEFPTDGGTRLVVALPSGPSEGTTATRSGVDSASAV
jgi:halimadienyl-diphosphate synthase